MDLASDSAFIGRKCGYELYLIRMSPMTKCSRMRWSGSRPSRIQFFLLTIVLLGVNLSQARSEPGQPIRTTEVQSGHAIQIDLGRSEKPRVFIFVSSRCPCSISHEVEILRLFREYQAQGIDFFAVHANSSEQNEAGRRYFVERAWALPVLADVDTQIANHFGAFKTPHVFFVSKEGKTIYSGALTDSRDCQKANRFYLEEALQAHLEGKSPKLSRTVAIGCEIERDS